MAVAQSHLFSRIRGSVGDLTYQQNQFATIVLKSKIVNPAYPDSTGQQNAKTSFEYAVDQWTSLSDDQRSGWEQWAKRFYLHRKLEKHKITGRLYFIKAVSFMKYLDIVYSFYPTPNFDPPVIEEPLLAPSIIALPYTGSSTRGYRYRLTNPNNYSIRIYYVASTPYNLARNRLTGPFLYDNKKQVTYTALQAYARNVNMDATYADKCVFVRFACISEDAPYRVCEKQIVRFLVEEP